jgi:hypothetical protein
MGAMVHGRGGTSLHDWRQYRILSYFGIFLA